MKLISYSLLVLFLVITKSVHANDFEKQLLANKALSDEAFLDAFLYKDFLKAVPTKEIKYYEAAERLLKDYQRPVAPFFLQLVEEQLVYEPTDIQNQAQLLDRLALGKFLVERTEREFQIASDVVFEDLAEQLEQGFQKGILQKEDATLMYLVEELKAQEYGVSIPVSDLEKGLYHLKRGNVQYIWSRLWFDHPVLCILGMISALGILYFIIRRIRRNKQS
ncbi:MAG: hypothetical protein ACRBFS_11335 [Aureispira sp.]